MGTVAACYLSLYLHIKRYRQELKENFDASFVGDKTMRERYVTLDKAGRRALLWSACFFIIPALVCFFLAREIQRTFTGIVHKFEELINHVCGLLIPQQGGLTRFNMERAFRCTLYSRHSYTFSSGAKYNAH